jgi:hypothetical protein
VRGILGGREALGGKNLLISRESKGQLRFFDV